MGRCVASMATGLVEVTTFVPRDLPVFEGPSWGSKSDREGGVWVLVVHSLHRHFSSGPLRVLVENGRQESSSPPPPEEMPCTTFLGGGSCQRPRFN